MHPFNLALARHNLGEISEAECVPSWLSDGSLEHAILNASDRTAPLELAVAALRHGAGVDALLDIVVETVSERMLRYDTAGEDDLSDDFNWLDITHGITYANAARHHHATNPGVDSVRLALYTVFLAHWTGRHEWHSTVDPVANVELPKRDNLTEIGISLQRAALVDPGSQFIVQAHAIKTSVAATHEATRTGSLRPLQAAARFITEPHRQRFVAGATERSIEFITRGRRDGE